MKAIPRILIAVLALMLSTATVAVADHGHDDRVSVVPAHRVGGSSAGDLLGDRFAQLLSLPASSSPFGNTANKCIKVGRHSKVLSPAGGKADPITGIIDMTCRIKAGQAVFLVGPSADCSSAEPDPFRAVTARDQRKCALGWLFDGTMTSIAVSVDGIPAADLNSPRFLAVSPQRHTVFNEDPVFGAEPGAKSTFVAAAWVAEIRGMQKENHVVTMVTTGFANNGTPFSFTFIVRFVIDRK